MAENDNTNREGESEDQGRELGQQGQNPAAQSQQNPTGQQGQQSETSQSSGGSQSDSALDDPTGQSGPDQGRESSQRGGSGSGFVGSQGSDSSEYLQEDQQSSSAQNFANSGMSR